MKEYRNVILGWLIVAIVVGSVKYYTYYRHKDPPPGYCIMTDGKHFFVQKDDPWGANVVTWADDVTSSRQASINVAWKRYERDKLPPIEIKRIFPIGNLQEVTCTH